MAGMNGQQTLGRAVCSVPPRTATEFPVLIRCHRWCEGGAGWSTRIHDRINLPAPGRQETDPSPASPSAAPNLVVQV